MKLFASLFLALLLVGCGRDGNRPSGTVARDSVIINDAMGTRVAVPIPAERIVSLAPNLTEILFALGAQDHLVGVTRFCTYPPAAQTITKVGDLQTPNYELLSALRPDIVFMSY